MDVRDASAVQRLMASDAPMPELDAFPALPRTGNLAMDTRSAARVLAALAHDLRLELWCMLAPCGEEGLAAGLIATRLAIPPSSLSFHLQQMTQAGLLMQRRRSRHILYAANDEIVGKLCRYLESAGIKPELLSPLPPPEREARDIIR